MTYFPPKIITNNAAPPIAADLAYEAHGKCGCETVILCSKAGGLTIWDSDNPGTEVEGCTDSSHVWKAVALEDSVIRGCVATNLSVASVNALITVFSFKVGSEILADFTYFRIVTGTVILYRDCDQS